MNEIRDKRLKPLDIVKTLNRSLAIIKQAAPVNDDISRFIGKFTYSIEYIGTSHEMDFNKVAWYGENDLIYIDSLPFLLARLSANYGVTDTKKALSYFYEGN